MPFIEFPNVPAVAGVPQLPFQAFAGGLGAGVTNVGEAIIASGGNLATAATLLTADDPSIQGVLAAPEWGVFDSDGNPIAVADTVVKLEFIREAAICDYPVEEGAFASYNKVQRPFEHRVSMSKGGSVADRQQFLLAITNALRSLASYQVRAPEGFWNNCQLVHMELMRSATQGAQLITVEVALREIRTAGSSTFTSTAQPSGAAQSNGGTVQAQTPTAGQATAAAGGAR